MPHKVIGVDIGGTQCSVNPGLGNREAMQVLDRRRYTTPPTPTAALTRIMEGIESLQQDEQIAAIGISCGGPLDLDRGLICSPPNLPGWDNIAIVDLLAQRFGVPVFLQNDANAGALAEWQWGAGQGCRNLIFLTFGTGMGAGLILDGRLYSGTNGLAGEVGHMRLAPQGPLGYGKAGSFEGFCSGGGLARYAQLLAREQFARGEKVSYCPSPEQIPQITAESVGKAAQAGNQDARAIWHEVGRRLGQGLALLVDIFNPERIILGSLYLRQQDLLEPPALQVLREEALPEALAVCQIVPAGLGERIGPLASLAVAAYSLPYNELTRSSRQAGSHKTNNHREER